MPAPESLPGLTWKGLLSIGIVARGAFVMEKKPSRYVISSESALRVKQFAHAVRSHWGIENTCHWSLDFTFREDDSRIRDELFVRTSLG